MTVLQEDPKDEDYADDSIAMIDGPKRVDSCVARESAVDRNRDAVFHRYDTSEPDIREGSKNSRP